MNILYIGDDNKDSTSFQRAEALIRLGHNVVIKNPNDSYREITILNSLLPFHYRTGYTFLQKRVYRWLKEVINSLPSIDLIWVNGGELLGNKCLKLLKAKAPCILYNNDDVTGKRDGRRFRMILKSIPYYDICVVRRVPNIEEYKLRGAKNVINLMMSYDEIQHCPFEDESKISNFYKSEVAFIGTLIPNERRDEFLVDLVEQGIELRIWGNEWKKSPHYMKLKPYIKGKSIYRRDYVAAIQGAKICLGFLSKGNRDLHTRRSVEVPFAGGLLCAERTSEHLEMYKEGVSAVFWNDSKECAKICKELLTDPKRRESIRLAGMQRVRALGVGNEDVCKKILDYAKINNII